MLVDIIGGGIGGLTLAIALKKQNISVRVFEQAEHIKEVGAGIVLANNAMQIYRTLGLSDIIAEKGNAISNINITNHEFKVLSTTSLVDFEKEYQLKNIAIHRGDLQKILVDQLGENELFLGHQLKTIKQKGELLEFTNGKEYTSSTIIGADGIFSKVRELLFPPTTIRDAKQVCWRGVLDYKLNRRNRVNEAWGKGSRFGSVQINSEKVYWYAVKSICSTNSELPEEIDTELFEKYHPMVNQLIASTPKKSIHTAFLQDIVPFKGWSKGNVCLLGDAAHATTPNMGQGACQAIEDAYLLASYLKNMEVSKAFQLYEKNRIAKAHQIVKTSFFLGKLSQLSNFFLRVVRNLVLKLTPSAINKKQMGFIFKITEV